MQKRSLILGPRVKSAAIELGISMDDLVRKVAIETERPVAVAFVSQNLYLGSYGPRPIAGLVASVMYHGEVGIDKLVGFSSEEDVLKESDIIDLLPRKVKCLFETSETILGACQSNLLMHAKKRVPLLTLQMNSLADHAWLACAFSYDRGGGISGGAAVRTRDGQVFRAGAIGELVTAREAVVHGMEANGVPTDFITEWCDCPPEIFRKHHWYDSNFSKLSS